ncbi:MAG TPA: NYN domain-containing protein [Gemmatimonadaceae bacterium]|nr:NYN domain-containing protein [Gemmatimonadaceae bacterium]
MNPRNQRREPTRSHGALIHRGPQATVASAHPMAAVPLHAPNAALLIDFDNVTMGIRSDLGNELRNLLGSDIIKGKVAVQRAYADWRRYPQYIVPLTEASIDLIFAPAYGSAKKNATDIRLAIDALELVFTRPEIGTFILLSGDSDFSSLVIKLKEYGKYVIGVGIRESSSDLLVMNCDEYYSYNALAGLVKASEEESSRTYDPWELVTEAIGRMKRNGDVMRSDRLKQVMQDIDSNFDEKNTGHSKFSRFVQDAAARGLLTLTKLENGQLEVGMPTDGAKASAPAAQAAPAALPPKAAPAAEGSAEERAGRRGRRGGRGRGRGGRPEGPPQLELSGAPDGAAPAAEKPAPAKAPSAPRATDAVGSSGERLTRSEAFDLMRRAVETLTTGDQMVQASAVRKRAHELLGRDSESLSERNFARILQDAHDADVIDLRRRGDDYEISRAVAAASVADQLAAAAEEAKPAPTPAPSGPRLGMGPRGGGGRGRGGKAAAPPPELLAIGVVNAAAPAVREAPPAAEEAKPAAKKPAGRKRAAGKPATKTAGAPAGDAADAPAKQPRKPRAKKTAAKA